MDRSPSPNPHGPGLRWLLLAAGAGTVHAAASLYWALGGTWLLETLGSAASARGTLRGVAVLVVAGLVKLVVAWWPVRTAPWRDRQRRVARALSWLAGAVLAAYGTVLSVAGWLALAGVFGEPTDPVSLRGHALLWDPLFALWGWSLLVGLWSTRSTRPTRSNPRAVTTEPATLAS